MKHFSSTNQQIFVQSDVNYTFRTPQFIKGDFRFQFRKNPDEVNEWYANGLIRPDVGEKYAHVRENTYGLHTVTLQDFCLNRSIESLQITPQA